MPEKIALNTDQLEGSGSWRIGSMAKKRHTAEEIVAKLRQGDVLIAQGRQVADAVRSIGVTKVIYYRWRNEYGKPER
jgi:hypothetical protein